MLWCVVYSACCVPSQLRISTSVSVTFWGFNLSWTPLSKCSECFSLSLGRVRRPGLGVTGSQRGWGWSQRMLMEVVDPRSLASVMNGLLVLCCGPGATTQRSSWGLASDVIVTSRQSVGVNLGTSHTNTASEHTNKGGWMQPRVPMTAKNPPTMSADHWESRGTFPGL